MPTALIIFYIFLVSLFFPGSIYAKIATPTRIPIKTQKINKLQTVGERSLAPPEVIIANFPKYLTGIKFLSYRLFSIARKLESRIEETKAGDLNKKTITQLNGTADKVTGIISTLEDADTQLEKEAGDWQQAISNNNNEEMLKIFTQSQAFTTMDNFKEIIADEKEIISIIASIEAEKEHKNGQ